MSSAGTSQTILLVDDDPVHIKFLENILTNNGYRIVAKSEAAEGLQFAIEQNPSLIVLDVMMPIINGYNFCRLLKSEVRQKHIPVIFLTSRDEAEDIEIGRQMGANAYLTKPVNTQVLLDKIKELLK